MSSKITNIARAALYAVGVVVPAIPTVACAMELPTTCAPISLVSAPTSFGQPVTYQVTNQCGQCASITYNIFNDGSAQGFASTHANMAPGEARKIVFTATKLGTTQARIVKVESCPTPDAPRTGGTTKGTKTEPHQPSGQVTVTPSKPVGKLMLCDNNGENCRTPPSIQPSSNPGPNTATIREVK
jgi:hypothetical protein